MDLRSQSRKRLQIPENAWQDQIQFVNNLVKANQWMHVCGIILPFGSMIKDGMVMVGKLPKHKTEMNSFRPLIYKAVYKYQHSLSYILELDIQSTLLGDFERVPGFFYIIKPKPRKSVIIRRVVNPTKSINTEIRNMLEECQRFSLLYCQAKTLKSK